MKEKLFQQIPLSVIRTFWVMRTERRMRRMDPTIKDLVRADINYYCLRLRIQKIEIENHSIKEENALLATSNQALAATVAYYESRNANG